LSKKKDEMQRVLDQTRRAISEHGHAVIGIEADVKSKPPTPGFAYTVGLESSYERPEMIVFGLPYEVAHGVLNDLAARIKQEGFSPSDGSTDEKTLRGQRVIFREVRRSLVRKHLKIAEVLEDDVRALQMIWPDPFGKFPWEPEFDQRYSFAQPLLYEKLH
jgi:hypothetical protein